jgi:peptide/nickel transport system ATP-binding protein
MSTLLQVRRLTSAFGDLTIVDDISFDINKGETLALVGESGSGKSITALSVMRLLPKPGKITQGHILLDQKNIVDLPVNEIRKLRGRRIGMIFQDPMTSLNPVHRVGDQIVEAIQLHEDWNKDDAMARAKALFEEVGIPDPEQRLEAYPHQLSGGLKQRVMIAMALSMQPDLLIADEPTTALDVTIQAQIIELLRQLQKSRGMSILLITHDLGVVNELADRVAVMYAGRIVETASRAELLSNPKHPYTRGLLKANPALGKRGHNLHEIPGVVPSPENWPQGCRFASRCEFASAKCMESIPPASRVGEKHSVFCYEAANLDAWSSADSGQADQPETESAVDMPQGSDQFRVRDLKTWFPIKQGILQRTVGHVQAVTDVNFDIPAGTTLALVGESGCGKSTTGRAVLRLGPADKGSVEFNGTDVFSLAPKPLREFRQNLQMVFQDPAAALNPKMRVRDAVAEGMKSFGIGESEEQRTELVKQLFERVRLNPEHIWRYPHEFSGGQRQRICIARSLAVKPKLIVFDEAVSALDVSIQAQILNLLAELQAELGISYLFISHDLHVVRHLAHQVAVMYLGRIVERGETEALFNNPQHPYTRALLAAAPSMDPHQRSENQPLKGDVPSPSNPPSGCAFHTRCPIAIDRCKIERPQEISSKVGGVSCHLAE